MDRKNPLIPLLEFDADKKAIPGPPESRKRTEQGSCVICFFPEQIRKAVSEYQAKKVALLYPGSKEAPLYEIEFQGKKTAFYLSGMGAPLAAFMLEQVIALGYTKFVSCGGAGSLDAKLKMGDAAIISTALRDEGTSYHYAPPSREIELDRNALATVAEVLREEGIPFEIMKTWTCDAIFRETAGKIKQRRQEGCSLVEMECAALAAASSFRGVKFSQLLYAADDLSSEKWQHRSWTKAKIRGPLFKAALKSAIRLQEPVGYSMGKRSY